MRDFKCMLYLDYNLHNEINILDEFHFTSMFIFSHTVYLYDTLNIHSFLQSIEWWTNVCRMLQ